MQLRKDLGRHLQLRKQLRKRIRKRLRKAFAIWEIFRKRSELGKGLESFARKRFRKLIEACIRTLFQTRT